MRVKSVQEQLANLAEKAYLKELETDDERDLEPYFLRIIEIAREDKDEAVQFFRGVIWGELPHPDSLLPFCARELRWSEIREEAIKRFKAKTPNPRLTNWISDINHAFDDVIWELVWTGVHQ